MSFIKQYDRLFVTTFGVVNLIRGGGGALEFVVKLTGKSTQGLSHGPDESPIVLGISFLLYMAVLTVSGIGLILRKPFGWKLAVFFHASDFLKLGGALILTALIGTSSAAIRMGTDVLVQMAWALFHLLVFLMKPIAEVCHLDGRKVFVVAVPWIFLGLVWAVIKLIFVI
jgi:hypothetical protein